MKTIGNGLPEMDAGNGGGRDVGSATRIGSGEKERESEGRKDDGEERASGGKMRGRERQRSEVEEREEGERRRLRGKEGGET